MLLEFLSKFREKIGIWILSYNGFSNASIYNLASYRLALCTHKKFLRISPNFRKWSKIEFWIVTVFDRCTWYRWPSCIRTYIATNWSPTLEERCPIIMNNGFRREWWARVFGKKTDKTAFICSLAGWGRCSHSFYHPVISRILFLGCQWVKLLLSMLRISAYFKEANFTVLVGRFQTSLERMEFRLFGP